MTPTTIDCHGDTISIRRMPSDFGGSICGASRSDPTALVGGKAGRVLATALAGDSLYSRSVRSAMEASRTYQRSQTVETSTACSIRRMGERELAKVVGSSAGNSLSDSILKNATKLAGAEPLSPTARQQADHISSSARIRGAGRSSVFGPASIRSPEPWNRGMKSALDVTTSRRIDPKTFEVFTSAGRLAKAKASADALASQFKYSPKDMARLYEQWGLGPEGQLAKAKKIAEKYASRTLLAQAKAMGFDNRRGSLQGVLGRQVLEAGRIGGLQGLGIGIDPTAYDRIFGVPRSAKLETPLGRSWSERAELWVPPDEDFLEADLSSDDSWSEMDFIVQLWHLRWFRILASGALDIAMVPVLTEVESICFCLVMTALALAYDPDSDRR